VKTTAGCECVVIGAWWLSASIPFGSIVMKVRCSADVSGGVRVHAARDFKGSQ